MINPAPVYILDDEPEFRRELCDVINRFGSKAIAFETGAKFLEASRHLKDGIIVMDHNMTGINGLEILKELRSRGSGHQIIMLSGMATIEMAVSAIHGGALTFLEKPLSIAKLVEALCAADAKLAAIHISRDTASSSLTQFNRLSRRERMVLEGIANGQQNKHMAHQLGLSVRTIEMYRRNLFKKLEVNSVAAATKIYLECTN